MPRQSRPRQSQGSHAMSVSSKHPETIVLHAGYRTRPGDQRRRGADLPDHLLPVPRHRARRQPVRAEGARQHLHPHHEPDQRRAGEARSRRSKAASRRWRSARARRRRRSRSRTSAQAGDNIVSSTDLYGGTWNLFANTLKHHGHRGALRRPGRPGELSAAPPTRAPAPTTPRPCPTRSSTVFPIARGRRHRPRARRAADHGQHRRAGPLPAVRAWRGDRRATRPPSTSAAMAPRSAA